MKLVASTGDFGWYVDSVTERSGAEAFYLYNRMFFGEFLDFMEIYESMTKKGVYND